VTIDSIDPHWMLIDAERQRGHAGGGNNVE
jgi:hypothetical protein